MSNYYKNIKEVPTSVLITRLKELSMAVSKHDINEFTMRIPAELDRDADIVLLEAADRLEYLSHD